MKILREISKIASVVTVLMIALGGGGALKAEPKESDEAKYLEIYANNPNNAGDELGYWEYYIRYRNGSEFDEAKYKSPDSTEGQEDGEKETVSHDSTSSSTGETYIPVYLPSPSAVVNSWTTYGVYTEVFVHFFLTVEGDFDFDDLYPDYKTRIYLRPELDEAGVPVEPNKIYVEGVDFT